MSTAVGGPPVETEPGPRALGSEVRRNDSRVGAGLGTDRPAESAVRLRGRRSVCVRVRTTRQGSCLAGCERTKVDMEPIRATLT